MQQVPEQPSSSAHHLSRGAEATLSPALPQQQWAAQAGNDRGSGRTGSRRASARRSLSHREVAAPDEDQMPRRAAAPRARAWRGGGFWRRAARDRTRWVGDVPACMLPRPGRRGVSYTAYPRQHPIRRAAARRCQDRSDGARAPMARRHRRHKPAARTRAPRPPRGRTPGGVGRRVHAHGDGSDLRDDPADLGAEVVKVEPLTGDNTRRLPGSGARILSAVQPQQEEPRLST